MSYQREFSHRLRAGLVGIGSHAYRNILPVMNFLPVQLVAVCNRSMQNPGKRKTLFLKNPQNN